MIDFGSIIDGLFGQKNKPKDGAIIGNRAGRFAPNFASRFRDICFTDISRETLKLSPYRSLGPSAKIEARLQITGSYHDNVNMFTSMYMAHPPYIIADIDFDDSGDHIRIDIRMAGSRSEFFCKVYPIMYRGCYIEKT
jgi:hypothetical protein